MTSSCEQPTIVGPFNKFPSEYFKDIFKVMTCDINRKPHGSLFLLSLFLFCFFIKMQKKKLITY